MTTWPEDWERRRSGVGCPACAEGRPDAIPDGTRFYAGATADAYLLRHTAARGYSVVFWRGPHVADITQLDDAQWRAFAAELRLVARVLESVYRPAKLNAMLLGNTLPHLHAHIVPRYLDDPSPEAPPVFMLGGTARQWDEADYAGELQALRKAAWEVLAGQ